MNTKKTKKVIVTTKHRGVFFGALTNYDEDKARATLKNARMAIYWGTTRGLYELAESGPTPTSKISAVAPRVTLHDVTSVIDVTQEAAKKFEAAK